MGRTRWNVEMVGVENTDRRWACTGEGHEQGEGYEQGRGIDRERDMHREMGMDRGGA
jgi:hypothetical protein